MNFKIALVCGALMLACIGAHSPVASGRNSPRTSSWPRRRPTPVFVSATRCRRPSLGTPSGDYEDILWDALLPEGWSVEKMMEGLNLNELGDNDPKARESDEKDPGDVGQRPGQSQARQSARHALPASSCRWMESGRRRASFCSCRISAHAYTHPRRPRIRSSTSS